MTEMCKINKAIALDAYNQDLDVLDDKSSRLGYRLVLHLMYQHHFRALPLPPAIATGGDQETTCRIHDCRQHTCHTFRFWYMVHMGDAMS